MEFTFSYGGHCRLLYMCIENNMTGRLDVSLWTLDAHVIYFHSCEWEVLFNWEWLVGNSFKTITFAYFQENWIISAQQVRSRFLPKTAWKWEKLDWEGASIPCTLWIRQCSQYNFFIFMQFLAKIMPNNRLAPGGWRPLWEILDPPLLTNLLKFHGHSKLFFKHSMWESICNGNYEITIHAMLMCLTTKRTFLTNNIIKTKK